MGALGGHGVYRDAPHADLAETLKRKGAIGAGVMADDLGQAVFLRGGLDQFVGAAVTDHALEGKRPAAGIRVLAQQADIRFEFEAYARIAGKEVELAPIAGGVKVKGVTVVAKGQRDDVGLIRHGQAESNHLARTDDAVYLRAVVGQLL